MNKKTINIKIQPKAILVMTTISAIWLVGYVVKLIYLSKAHIALIASILVIVLGLLAVSIAINEKVKMI